MSALSVACLIHHPMSGTYRGVPQGIEDLEPLLAAAVLWLAEIPTSCLIDMPAPPFDRANLAGRGAMNILGRLPVDAVAIVRIEREHVRSPWEL